MPATTTPEETTLAALKGVRSDEDDVRVWVGTGRDDDDVSNAGADLTTVSNSLSATTTRTCNSELVSHSLEQLVTCFDV